MNATAAATLDNTTANTLPKLAGIGVGNGCVGDKVGACSNQGTKIDVDFLYGHGAISQPTYAVRKHLYLLFWIETRHAAINRFMVFANVGVGANTMAVTLTKQWAVILNARIVAKCATSAEFPDFTLLTQTPLLVTSWMTLGTLC